MISDDLKYYSCRVQSIPSDATTRSFAAYVRTTEHEPHVTNGCRYAHAWEVHKAASDLYGRWTIMRDDWQIRPTTDPVNYYWDSHRCEQLPAERWEGTDEDTGSEARAIARAAYQVEMDRRQAIVSAAVTAACASYATYREATDQPAFVELISTSVLVAKLPPHVRDAIRRIGYTLAMVPLHVAQDKIVVSGVVVTAARDASKVGSQVSPRDARSEITTIVDASTGSVVESWRLIHERDINADRYGARVSTSVADHPVRMIPDGGCIVTARDTDSSARNLGVPEGVVLHARAVDALAWLYPDDPACGVIADSREQSGGILHVTDDGRRSVRGGSSAVAWQCAYNALGAAIANDRPEYTPLELIVLHSFVQLKSAARQREMLRHMTEYDLNMVRERLLLNGLIRKSKTGAMTVTADGRLVVAANRCPVGQL